MNAYLKISILFLVALIIGCSSSDKQKVDNFLDDYEKAVVKWEAKIVDGEFTEVDSDDMNKIIEEMEANAKELQKVNKWSKEQQERYANLTERIMDAIFKTIKMPEGFPF